MRVIRSSFVSFFVFLVGWLFVWLVCLFGLFGLFVLVLFFFHVSFSMEEKYNIRLHYKKNVYD